MVRGRVRRRTFSMGSGNERWKRGGRGRTKIFNNKRQGAEGRIWISIWIERERKEGSGNDKIEVKGSFAKKEKEERGGKEDKGEGTKWTRLKWNFRRREMWRWKKFYDKRYARWKLKREIKRKYKGSDVEEEWYFMTSWEVILVTIP